MTADFADYTDVADCIDEADCTDDADDRMVDHECVEFLIKIVSANKWQFDDSWLPQ